jgi:H+-transporting ATPase
VDQHVAPTKFEEEEEDEDIDALIEELESQDAGIDAEEEEVTQPGGARPVAEDLLQTDTRTGLTSAEVLSRRKKFGLNQMKGTSYRRCSCVLGTANNAQRRRRT